MDFSNQQLSFDLENIKSFDKPLDIQSNFDDSQEEPTYILDVNDNGYFYTDEEDRNMDMKKLLISLIV